tara:strand:- start:66 stop:1457 length:1392 start_codon:yes stop_codon:yes gene_type:complete
MTIKILLPLVLILFVQKILSLYFTNFDLFGDEAQYWLWSQDLDYGYFSKPPLLAWVIALFSYVFGDSFFSLKIIPSFTYIFTAWAVYNLCKNIGLKKENSYECLLLFLLMPAVSFSSFILSTDILLLLFWTLALNELVVIRKFKSFKNFLMFGIFIGLAFLSKYAAIYFVICLIIYILLDRDFRKFFFKNYLGFLFSFFCIFIILLPNLIWNLNNGWVTLQHTSDNANFGNIEINFLRGFEFLCIQILMLSPLLFIGGILNYKNIVLDEKQKLLLIFSLPIFFIVLVEAVVVRANANWAAPGFISLFVFLYILNNNDILKKLNIVINSLFCLIFFLLIGLTYQNNIFNRISGINEFSNKIHSFSSNAGIVDFVISDRLLFSNIKYEMRNNKNFFYMPHKTGERITNHFKLTSPLEKEMKKNFIFIGYPNEINYLENDYNLKKLITMETSFVSKKLDIYEVTFN